MQESFEGSNKIYFQIPTQVIYRNQGINFVITDVVKITSEIYWYLLSLPSYTRIINVHK